MRRIQRAKDKEDIIQLLMSDQVGVFREIWRLLLFAAQIGFKVERREILTAIDTGKGIDQSTFSNSPAWPGILYLMALTENEHTDSLSGREETDELRLKIFQEYANGGLTILKNYFRNRNVEFDGLLGFISDHTATSTKTVDLDIVI